MDRKLTSSVDRGFFLLFLSLLFFSELFAYGWCFESSGFGGVDPVVFRTISSKRPRLSCHRCPRTDVDLIHPLFALPPTKASFALAATTARTTSGSIAAVGDSAAPTQQQEQEREPLSELGDSLFGSSITTRNWRRQWQHAQAQDEQQREQHLSHPKQSITDNGVNDNDENDDLDDAFVQSQWMMPSIVERVLIHQETDSINPYELLNRLDMSDADRTLALKALDWNADQQPPLVQTELHVLTSTECAKLRQFLHQRIENDGVDNVDGCPDWQVNLTPKKLTKIIGTKAVDRLLIVPERLFGVVDENKKWFEYERVGIFIRLYERSKRPWMPFHRDGNRWTVNVALNNATDYLPGGRLLALYNGAVRRIDEGNINILEEDQTKKHQCNSAKYSNPKGSAASPRGVNHRMEGDATCHAGYIQHAVSAMMPEKNTKTNVQHEEVGKSIPGENNKNNKATLESSLEHSYSGRRYSMILFYHTVET